ncbi:hypothetical protein T552_00098 [Pneumocystis carinii B80]|uniref:Uncharacterized protein n=1 Tax=Pneumocystis carinii (strain B80) TaxID=1408658 RepID=A0A0W4ZSW6_PNEC8|nr:hypothetical protein T552_00098 [Pneumocystis carinii B80]KTW31456.1 hypothetical protein T552_00098 [Pneumocystis carinii B80]
MRYTLNSKLRSFCFIYKLLWKNYSKSHKSDIFSDFFPKEKSIIVLRNHKSKIQSNSEPLVQPLEENYLELLSRKLIYDYPDEMDDTSINEIDSMKPSHLFVSLDLFNQIIKNMKFSFNRKQIQKYAKLNGLKNISRCSCDQLIEAILKEIWELKISDNICSDILMVKEIHVNKRDLFFMTRSNKYVLQQWARNYQAKIYIDFDKSILQVEGLKSNIERVEERIVQMAKDIKIEDIDIRCFSMPKYFDDRYISEISSLSGTFIEKIDINRIRITVLRNELESLDNAKMLISMSLISNDSKSYSLIYNNSSNNNSFYYFGEKFSLPWYLRGKKWARWKTIIHRNENNFFPKDKNVKNLLENEYYIAIENGFLKSNSNVISTLYDTRKFLDNHMVYSNNFPKAKVQYDIIFGYVLHDCSLENIYKQFSFFQLGQHFEKNVKNDEIRRIFCSNISRGFPFIHKLKSCYKDGFLDKFYKKTLRLKFVSSPWVRSDLDNSYIEIDLELDNKGSICNTIVKYISCESILDVLLPECGSDLRISRKTFSFLDPNNKLLMEYLNMIQIGITSNKLGISPTLSIEIPSESEDISKVKEYILIRMEYINQIDFKLNKFLLRFLTIEGNMMTGRRVELKLLSSEFSIMNSTIMMLNDQDWRDFINNALMILNKLS